jgi:hypothetical protein
MLMALLLAGCGLWLLHAESWSLGRRSPVLDYDTSQYALAARELAQHGRLATTYALPIELARHPRPPWPLALVQPGLVVLEAAAFRLAPRELLLGGHSVAQWSRPDQIEWLVIPIVFTSYMMCGILLGLAVAKLLKLHAPGVRDGVRMAAGGVIGLAFLLDPEAQHFGVGGFTELPFTWGLIGAIALLALDRAQRRPLLFGLLLGITGAFRINMLWLAPVLMIAAVALAARDQRIRVAGLVLLGFAIPLLPWWIYQWRAFGTPAWNLGSYVIWDGVQGRTWFTLNHLPEPPRLPRGAEAFGLLAGKALHNLPRLLLATVGGPRALWIGALVAWLFVAHGPRALRIAGMTAFAVFAIGLFAAAIGVPWLRYVFPGRVVLEAAGILAVWGLIAAAPEGAISPRMAIALRVAVAVLALGWGASQTAAGNREAREASGTRGVPGTQTLLQIAVLMNREIAPGEPVMSNLGPALAWHARRPVIHLALAPEDLDACRRRLDFRYVLLVFRDPEHAWGAWSDVVAHPLETRQRPELNVAHVRRYESPDGFVIIWLELGPLGPGLASAHAPRTTFAVAAGGCASAPKPTGRLRDGGSRGAPGSCVAGTAAFAASVPQTLIAALVAPSAREADSTSAGATQMMPP